MSTLPLDNTFEDPTHRAPLVLGHEEFGTVTEEICRVNEGSSRPACQLTSSGIRPVSNSPRNRRS